MRFPLKCVCDQAGECPAIGRGVTIGHHLECRSNRLFRDRIHQRSNRPELPGIARQAFNFGKAVIRHVMAGCPTVSNEEMDRRQAICLGCDQYLDERCAKCGCRLKSKTAWALERCPLGKWETPIVS